METIYSSEIDTELSRIALGTWAIGGWMWGGTEEKQSIKTIHSALDKGINIIDTAPIYGGGRSEEITGKAMKEYGKRDKIILATKVGLDWDKGVKRDSSRERISKEIDDSLRRLGTDYIDIYQIHWPDYNTSFEETGDALTELKKQGKIRAIGVSNFSPEQMEELGRYCEIFSNQPPYNIFEREVEKDVLPYSQENKIKTLAYGALCRGMLSGKMSKKREFKGDDLRNDDPKFQEPRYSQYLSAVAELDKFARENYNKEVIHLALRYILDKGVEFPIWGARHPGQLDPLSEIYGWKLDGAALEQIDEIVDRHVKQPVGPEFMAPPK